MGWTTALHFSFYRNMRFSRLKILNPKRESEAQTGRASWYPYYAGFSEKFAQTLIESAHLPLDAKISDPWNGSGTTTAAAAGLGHHAYGYDLNPVMVLAARARLLSKRMKASLIPLGRAIAAAATEKTEFPDDPLNVWFMPRNAIAVRTLERAIQKYLIEEKQRFAICTEDNVAHVSDLAAFFYVALFRTTRTLLKRFDSTNPTWIKRPASAGTRLRPTAPVVRLAFIHQVEEMTRALEGDPLSRDNEVKISVGSSAQLPLADSSVDFVVSSPPYCTRIDYAVATQPELALLGYRIESEFDELRRKLIGTSTVPQKVTVESKDWGNTCLKFLDRLESHPSKASSGYYLKNHLQYFNGIYQSLGEISRTLKKHGACVLVVQDSYYKDLHNDVPQMIVEMADNQNMLLRRNEPFLHRQTMARVNPGVRKYRTEVNAVESVLCFVKN